MVHYVILIIVILQETIEVCDVSVVQRCDLRGSNAAAASAVVVITNTLALAGARADMSAATERARPRPRDVAQGSLTFARPNCNSIPAVARMQPSI